VYKIKEKDTKFLLQCKTHVGIVTDLPV